MKIWLDDIRIPPSEEFIWIRTASEVIECILTGGVTFCDFDHDLGEGKTGYDVATFIERGAHFGSIPHRIGWRVHSANPVGAKNIQAAMESAELVWKAREE